MGDGRNLGGLAGGIVGGVVGAYFGGPSGFFFGASLGASVGGMVGGAIDPPKGNLPNAQGPMEVQVNTFHRNLPVPVTYGICKVGGNIIWMGNIKSRIEESGGGKGKPKIQKVFYSADWAIALSEGPILGVGRFWLNEQEPKYSVDLGKEAAWTTEFGQVFLPVEEEGTVGLTISEANFNVDATVYQGTPTQEAPQKIIDGTETGEPPAHRNLCYVLMSGQLGQTPQIPTVSVELAGRLAVDLGEFGFDFPLTFNKWADPAEWDNLNPVEGDFFYPNATALVADSYPMLINKILLDGFNHAHIDTKNTYMDADKDWTLEYYVTYTANVLQNSMRFGLGIYGRPTSPGGVQQLIGTFLACGATFPGYWSASFQMYVTGTSPGVFSVNLESSATLEAIGTPKSHNLWVRIKKTGDNIKIYLKVDKISEGSQFSTFDWELKVDQNYTESFDPTAYTPARLTTIGEQTVGGGSDPFATGFVSSVFYQYHTTVPLEAADSSNPALAVLDFLINTRYGVGLPVPVMNVQSFADEAQFCDEVVSNETSVVPPLEAPSPFTIPEKRFKLDINLTEKKNALEHLMDMLATFRAFLVYQAGQIYLRIEKKEISQQSFTDQPEVVSEGIIEGSFSFSEISSRERPNRVNVEFVRDDDGYRRDFAQASDEWDQDVRGEVVEKTFTLLGIKRQTQARRMVQFFLDQAIFRRYLCKFRVGVGAMKAMAGDVIDVTHQVPGWVNKTFRIASIKEMENDELELGCIEYVYDVYHDREVPAVLDTTKIVAGDAFVNPPNVIRLRAFEPRDNSLPVLYVTWTMPPDYDFFLDAFLFRKRGDGLFEGQGTFVVNSSTAYLDHARIGFDEDPVPVSPPTGIVRISGDVTGMRGKIFDEDGVLIDDAAESGGFITLDVSSQSDPFDGYVQLYYDSSFLSPAIRGRFPVSGNFSFDHDSELVYHEEEVTYAANPEELRAVGIINSFEVSGDLQVATSENEDFESSYGLFEEALDGDKFTDVTWPLQPEDVELDNRMSDLKIYELQSGTYFDRTAAFADVSTEVAFFETNGRQLYIGSETKKPTAIKLLLSRLASVSVVPTFHYAVDTIGGPAAFAVFETVADGTTGFTQSGDIVCEPPQDWVKTSKDLVGDTIGDGVARYYIVIKRTAATVATAPKERRAFYASDLLLTMQTSTTRLDFPYTDDDLNKVLSFEALAENVTGLTADQDKMPIDTITIQRFSAIPLPVGNPELDIQGSDFSFIGGDLVLNWLNRSRFAGANAQSAGVDPEGAGGDPIDFGFEGYVLQFWETDGSVMKRQVFVPVTDDAKGTYTYTEEDRFDDDLGNSLMVKIFQKANGLFSEPFTVFPVSAGIDDVPEWDNLPDIGTVFVPDWDEILDLDTVPDIDGNLGV